MAKRNKIYDTVRAILYKHPRTRNSDKELIWTFWWHMGALGGDGKLTSKAFFSSATPESITRARRKVQENHPELQAVKRVEAERRRIADKYKGVHTYNQDDQGKLI